MCFYSKIRQQNGITILEPNGKLIGPSVSALRAALLPELEVSEAPRILINFENVNKIESRLDKLYINLCSNTTIKIHPSFHVLKLEKHKECHMLGNGFFTTLSKSVAPCQSEYTYTSIARHSVDTLSTTYCSLKRRVKHTLLSA